LLAASIAGAAAAALLPAGAGAVGAPQQKQGTGSADRRAAAAQSHAPTSAPVRALAQHLGPQATVSIDPLTKTPRSITRTDGALTTRSSASAASIALNWVRDRQAVFGLDDADLSALGTPSQVGAPSGLRVVTWRQSYRGLPVVGAGLRAAVAGDGRLLAVQGAPLRDTAVESTAPAVSASSALMQARAELGAGGAVPRIERARGGPRHTTTFTDDSAASLVVTPSRDGNRLAWHVIARVDSTHIYSMLVDARTGAVMKRANMVRFANPSGAADAWAYTPSPLVAANGGDLPRRVTFGDSWVADGSSLFGRYAWAYADVDDLGVDGAVEVPARSEDAGLPLWDYPFTNVGDCPGYPCSWDPAVPESWRTNLEQNAVQAFTFVNTFAEHLRAPPIGFDEQSHNFSWMPGQDDGILVETSDGANTAGGLPDDNHINNANMYTPPDGAPLPYPYPTMQMYLFDGPVHGNGGDDAAVVYHEFTHGLSNRLIADIGTGEGALSSPQAGAMGEAWSDWYALDFLVGDGTTGYQLDDPEISGELVLAAYLSAGHNWLRDSAVDCPVGVENVDNCPDGGGFTYADYGRVSDGPEVHADGEIWAQTLWDLRTALVERYGTDVGEDGVDGIERARELVTDAMRITPQEPTFLDARDAILNADTGLGGDDHDLIWEVFARRGMGFYASSDGPYDPTPFADFALPPTETATATLSGTITDRDTGTPLPGVTVSLPGNAMTATTGSDGRYTLGPVVRATYPRVLFNRAGYDAPATDEPVTIDAGGAVRDIALRRNWALESGGTRVLAGIDPEIGGECAAEHGIDGRLAYGWASYSPQWDGIDGDPPQSGFPNGYFPDSTTAPRVMRLMLPQTVDVSEFLLDPGAICGDDDSASLGEFTIETADGSQQLRLAYDGRGANRFVRAARPNHRLHTLTPIAGTTTGVRYVKITMYNPQGGDGSSWKRFMDLAEFGIHGTVTPERRGPEEEPRDPPREQPRDVPRDQPREQPRGTDRTTPRFLQKPTVVPKKRALTALRSRSGLPVRFRLDEATRVKVTVTLPLKTARTLGLTKLRKGKTFRLSGATIRSLGAKKTGTVRLKLSTAARRKLARTKSLRITLSVSATDSDGLTTTATVKPLLKR
jgi:hypothetical protein